MEGKQTASIPYFAHEMEMTRLESANRRLTWLAVIGWAVAGCTVALMLLR